MSTEEDELPEITAEMQDYIDAAIQGAAECVLWQASDASEDGGRGFPISDGGNEWSEKVISDVPYITEAVTAFVQGNWALLQIAAEHRKGGYDGGQCGHDLILTANHHGAGFWDRELDMPAYDSAALAEWRLGRVAYEAWLAEYRPGPLDRPRTVGDMLTTNSKGYSFEAEFDLDDDGEPTWIMVENVVLLDLAGYSSDPDGDDENPCTHKPYVVTDSKGVPVGSQTPVLGDFDTEQEAAKFIDTLPEKETGRYNLDGPADDDS